MSNTVRSIIQSVIEEQGLASTVRPYQRLVDGVVTALEARDEEIADALAIQAEELELDPRQVDQVLVSVGLRPQPEPEVTAEPASTEERLGKLESLVERLVSVAESRLGARI